MDRITKLSERYIRRVFADVYDTNLRNLIINTPPDPDGLSFRDAAEIVIENLSSIDPSGKDEAVLAPIHMLMNILNNNAVPEAKNLLNTTNTAYSVVQTKARADREKNTNAKYLANLSKVLVYKYYQQSKDRVSQPGSETKQTPEIASQPSQPKENVVKFLQRMFRTLNSGGKANESDMSIWKGYRNQLIGRLNSLNALPNRSPRQEEERRVIELVKNKLG